MTTTPRYRDLAVLLPLAGGFLLMSPLIVAFNSVRLAFGLPVIVLYVFGVWLLLILGAIFLARHLAEDEVALPLSDPLADPRAGPPPAPSDNPPASPPARPLGNPPAQEPGPLAQKPGDPPGHRTGAPEDGGG